MKTKLWTLGGVVLLVAINQAQALNPQPEPPGCSQIAGHPAIKLQPGAAGADRSVIIIGKGGASGPTVVPTQTVTPNQAVAPSLKLKAPTGQ